MSIAITSLYAALFGIMLVALSARISRFRGTDQVGVGDGDVKRLQLAVRVQANFIEYVPLALLLMLLIEIGGGQALFLHIIAIVLLLARLAHAWGLSRSDGVSPGRLIGTVGTWLSIVVMAGYLLWQFASAPAAA